MVKLVTHKASSEARRRAHKLIEDVRKHKLIDKHYKFFCRPIGSQKRKCIVQDEKGKYDLDFQVVLTKNSKDGDNDPTAIKKDFLRAFTDCKNQNEKVEDSTTVVTVRCSKNSGTFDANQEKFSFDFVIISIDEEKRIRRNGPNQFTWVQLPRKNSYIYERFKKLTGNQQRELLEENILPRIVAEKKKNEGQRIPTIDIFYTEVNNYCQEELLKYIDFDSDYEESRAKFYMNIKGVALHIKVLNYLGFEFGDGNKIKWKVVSEKLSQDKLLRDKLYIYLATLEEYIRAYIANKYCDNLAQDFWINGISKRNQIKNQVLSGKELFDILEDVDFGTLIKQVLNLPNKDREELFDGKGTEQNIEAVRELRNAVSHHKFMFSHKFLNCSVDGSESHSLENNIKNLRQLLPLQYRYGENGNGGITADMQKCNINL